MGSYILAFISKELWRTSLLNPKVDIAVLMAGLSYIFETFAEGTYNLRRLSVVGSYSEGQGLFDLEESKNKSFRFQLLLKKFEIYEAKALSLKFPFMHFDSRG